MTSGNERDLRPDRMSMRTPMRAPIRMRTPIRTSMPTPGARRGRRGGFAIWVLLAWLMAGGIGLPGCASVAPYEKEHLADPILALDAEVQEEAREVKWLEAREGSTGGVGGAGGGCACN